VSERLRLFVALDLPAPVRAALATWCAGATPDGVRCVPAENLHVTLAFLGARSPEGCEMAAAILEPLASAAAVGELATDGAVWLPPRRPRVLAVAIAPEEGLAALQAALVERLREAVAFEPEARRFRPHVTVGRVARGSRATAAVRDPVPALTFAVQAMTLYRSRTAPGGARYEALASVALAALRRP
jgi:2'-5' RNA ligase